MRTRVLSFVAAALLLFGIAPSTASAQCYSPGFGPGYYYPRHYSYYHPAYPVFVPYYRHSHYAPFYRHRRYWY